MRTVRLASIAPASLLLLGLVACVPSVYDEVDGCEIRANTS